MKSNTLVLQDLVVGRDGIAYTAALHAEIAPGEWVAVCGHNGSGKTSLLKTIAGLIPPVRGQVQYRGMPMRQQSGAVVYVSHKRGLIANLTVYENVALWARLSGYPELAAAALHFFDLGDSADIPVQHLSAGWQQRVALTRLITQPAGLWLLDEPAANLDAKGEALLGGLIESRCAQGGIALYTTHRPPVSENIKSIKLNG